MTSLAFVCCCLPLWFATGAGGVSRQILGTVVIGGTPGWQIALIAAGAALLTAALAVTADRMRAARRRVTRHVT